MTTKAQVNCFTLKGVHALANFFEDLLKICSKNDQ